jgi:hypothetical protein
MTGAGPLLAVGGREGEQGGIWLFCSTPHGGIDEGQQRKKPSSTLLNNCLFFFPHESSYLCIGCNVERLCETFFIK